MISYQSHLWKNAQECFYYFIMVWFLNKHFDDYTIEKCSCLKSDIRNVILDDYAFESIRKLRMDELTNYQESDGNHLSTCTKEPGRERLEKQLFRMWWRNNERGNCARYMTYLINHKIFASHEQESVLATAKGNEENFTNLQRCWCIWWKKIYMMRSMFCSFQTKNSLLIRKMIDWLRPKIHKSFKANMNLRAIRVNKDDLT